jgi:hypothetical protein
MTPDDIGFDADQFHDMSVQEKIRTSRLLAARARQIAKTCNDKYRDSYPKIAAEWDKLAADMERQR